MAINQSIMDAINADIANINAGKAPEHYSPSSGSSGGNNNTVSIVDYLKSIGQSSSFASRKALAKKYGISNYTGTASQNTQLLNAIKSSSNAGVTETPSPTVTPAPTETKAPETKIQINTSNPVSVEKGALKQALLDKGLPYDDASVDALMKSAGKTRGAWYEYRAVLGQIQSGEMNASEILGVEPTKEEAPGVEGYNLEDDPEFQSLPQELRDLLLTADLATQGNPEKTAKIAEALRVAEGQSNAYIGEAIRIAASELERNIGIKTDDLNSNILDLTTSINRIKEDLATGKDALSIEEQAELKRQQRAYEQNLEGLQENISAKGLTFSSRRALAETRLSDENTDVMESTERQYARQLKELELAASRGEQDATKQIEDLQKAHGVEVGDLVRGTEQLIGTDKLPVKTGAIGGVTGQIEDDKWKDIMDRAKGLGSISSMF